MITLHGNKPDLWSVVVVKRSGEIGIPKGTPIKKAYLQSTIEKVSTEQTNLVIHAELAANAEPFTNSDHNISSRKQTTASVKWSPEAWNGAGERAEKQRTPDLSPLIQQVIALEIGGKATRSY